MGYLLNAVIAKSAIFSPIPAWLGEKEIVDLTHGFQMVPITEALLDRVSTNVTSGDVLKGFYFLTRSLWEHCLTLSERGSVAYIADDCCGGICDQHSIVWQNREAIMGPLDKYGAVNRALRQLSVPRTLRKDEFDSLGLGRYRETEEWLAEGT